MKMTFKPSFSTLMLFLFAPFAIVSCKDDNPQPTADIIAINPTEGPKGTAITIAGINFGTDLADVQVTINDKAAEVTAVSNSKIVVNVPSKAGTGNVIATVRGVTITTQPFFTYQLSVSTLAGTGEIGLIDGAGTAAKFYAPSGIAVDADGNVLVTDFQNCRIRKITPAGVVSTLAGSDPFGYAEGPGDAAKFYGPDGIVSDAQGNFYVPDEGNHSIRKITKDGVVSTLAGNGSAGYADGTGSAARFYVPSGIAIDKNGILYVADQFANRIRKVTQSGVVTTLAGTTTPGWVDGAGATAQFNRPVGVAVDDAGNVFVGDLFNHRIRKISPTGVVTTLTGTGIAGFADGAKDVAKFQYPAGVALGPDGMLYVTDTENSAIRKVDPNGLVTTLVGRSEGHVDGSLDVALFRAPREIDIAADGTIYVADAADNTIRKID
ncbi:MAG TPA: IPT/TIG domain-containing protein [Chryseolinea sp.]|nr:IPT/TIG domain-containing protein [Chryseolinea sp.]